MFLILSVGGQIKCLEVGFETVKIVIQFESWAELTFDWRPFTFLDRLFLK